MIQILKPGDEEALTAFLRPRIESSLFLLGNMRAAGLVDRGDVYHGTYAAAFAGGTMTGVAVHYWNENVILQAPLALIAELVHTAVATSKRPVKGLIGPQAQVAAAKEALHIADAAVQLDETEKLYSLSLQELKLPEGLQTGQVQGRRMAGGDLDQVAKWRTAFAIEALQEKDGPALRMRNHAAVKRSLAEGRTWVLETEGRLVACSSFNTAVAEAVQVGGVWTPPALRGRGYGRAAVAASLLDAQADGVPLAILFTGVDNVPAQRAYEALGFQHIGDYRMLFLREPLCSF